MFFRPLQSAKPALKTKEQRAFEAIVSEAAAKQGEGAFYTAEAPGDFSAAKHVPTIAIEGRKATIGVPHGQPRSICDFVSFLMVPIIMLLCFLPHILLLSWLLLTQQL